MYAVGVDIGGQTSKIGVVDADGRILSRVVIRTDCYGTDAAAYLEALRGAIVSCLDSADLQLEDICGIGVGAPNANYYNGCIEYAANIAWASTGVVPISGELSSLLGGVRVVLTNDANAAAMGEMRYGVVKGCRDFIMITLGTGVGSGIVVDGRLVYGHDGNAGELGHIIVEPGGRPCGCGRRGCLETYCSATGVANTAREWIENTKEPSLLREADNISSKTVYEAAIRGDKMAVRIFEYTGEVLGRSLANFVAFSAPESIVLFGGLTKAREFFYEPLVKAMNDNVMPIWRGKVRVLFSQLEESDAAILGASALAWDL